MAQVGALVTSGFVAMAIWTVIEGAGRPCGCFGGASVSASSSLEPWLAIFKNLLLVFGFVALGRLTPGPHALDARTEAPGPGVGA